VNPATMVAQASLQSELPTLAKERSDGIPLHSSAVLPLEFRDRALQRRHLFRHERQLGFRKGDVGLGNGGQSSPNLVREHRRLPYRSSVAPSRLVSSPRSSVCSVLLQPNGITAADLTAPQHGGIDANVGVIILRGRAQDARIPREICLG
jgi:hypothetical protein